MFVSCFTCSTPPTREIDVWAVSPQCQQLDRVHVTIGPPYHGPGYVWARAETRVVKNGTPKNECLFHGTFLVGGSGYTILSPYLQTIKTFDAAGVARSEKGVFNFSTDDGRMFIGKIKVTWPQ